MCTVVIAVKLICRILWTTPQSNVDPSYPDSHLRDTLLDSESCSHMYDWHAEIGKVSACCPGSGDSRKPEVSTHADRPDSTIIAKINQVVIKLASVRGWWVAK